MLRMCRDVLHQVRKLGCLRRFANTKFESDPQQRSCDVTAVLST